MLRRAFGPTKAAQLTRAQLRPAPKRADRAHQPLLVEDALGKQMLALVLAEIGDDRTRIEHGSIRGQ
ncbi:hypothetical protein ACWCQS_09115 [Streptomyces sp. NPDC002076]